MFPKQNTAFFIEGPVGRLEAIMSFSEASAPNEFHCIAIICHPHPLYEGSMHNKVVTTLSKTFNRLGLATLRFNFRGVGKSEGSYGDVEGEVEDLRAALGWLRQQAPQAKYWLAGFSFGAYIAAKMAQEWPTEHLISIAPSVEKMDFAALTHISCPWLVVQGDEDEVVSAQAVWELAARPPSPLTLIRMPGVGHYFHGHLLDLQEALLKALPDPRVDSR